MFVADAVPLARGKVVSSGRVFRQCHASAAQ